jgi:lipopolysaccharide transport system ATP-binding protein
MTGTVLRVDGLGKAFRTYRSEWSRVLSWFGAAPNVVKEQWVLRNIGFRVAPGEAVGLVGQNGDGKSTLLKLITGTLRPTAGTVEVHGRIAAILELGMGMNPEFTGRQNVYNIAGLMGLTRDRIDLLMPEIEDFAEIGDYFDQPLRI